MSKEFENHNYTEAEIEEAYEMFAELSQALPSEVVARGPKYAIGYMTLFITNETADFVEAELNSEFMSLLLEAQANTGKVA